jgi:hypothetical protein
MTTRTIGHRLFTDSVAWPVYEDERGQFIEEDGATVPHLDLSPPGTTQDG